MILPSALRLSAYCTVTVPTIPGWIAQWYGNDPALGNVLLNEPCGAIDPEFHTLPSDVDVCVTVSELVHVTVVPGATVMGFGANAFVVRVDAPETIETVIPEPPVAGAGVGEGIVAEDDPPQPKHEPSMRVRVKKR